MKQFFTVILFLLVLFPAVSDEYKICYSSVTMKENAEYIARGLENNGLKAVFEPTVVFGRDYIRVLSAETYSDLQEALTVKNTLAGISFIRRLGLDSLWIRVYPTGYPASGFVFSGIPDMPEAAPRPAEPARAAAPPPRQTPQAEEPAAVPEITAAPPKPEPKAGPAPTPVVESEPAAEPEPAPEEPSAEAEVLVEVPEEKPAPAPPVPEPEAETVSEAPPESEPEASPMTEDLPEVVEEEAVMPEPSASAEVTIRPKAEPEAPAKSEPETPTVEDSAPPAAPKAVKEVPESLAPPEAEEPAETAAEESLEEEPVVEQSVDEEPAPVEEVVEEAPPAEAEPVIDQPVAEETAAAGLPSTEADDVFAFHRDNFVAAYEYLRTFADEGSSDEAVRLAKSIPLFLKAAEAALSDFAAYLPDPLSNYEKENPEAKEIRLASKASFLKNTYIPRVRENLEGLKSDILAAMESDAEWLASEYANIKHAPAALERIKDNAETLKTIASEDADLLSRADAVLAEAEKSYAALSEKIAENRMPADKYEGDDAAQLKAEMAVLYEALFPGERVRQVVIVSEDWREEASAKMKDGKIVAGVYRYIQAALAIARERDENAAVYTIGFRRTWTGSGDDFGPVELYSIGSSYPILPENLEQ